ncbi:MAG: HK97 family phage prohead protease [Alphaproteobacteria bacterium]|nr:MAG: HK97 family phage prohead protease [Alphaproteobacteria bacterium]
MHKTHHAALWQLKELDTQGVFCGYASVFDVVDGQRDVVKRGAFHDSIQQGTQGIKLLWQHAMHEPIGVIEELKEDVRGLYVRGRLLLEVERAREAYALLKSGAVTGLSIGYTPTRYRIDPDSGIRMISAIDLREISLVTFPANEQARVTVVKARDDGRRAFMAACRRAMGVLSL